MLSPAVKLHPVIHGASSPSLASPRLHNIIALRVTVALSACATGQMISTFGEFGESK